MLPSRSLSIARAQVECWTTGIYACSETIADGFEARFDIGLREVIDVGLGRLVRRFKDVANLVQSSPEPRVASAIHASN